MVITHSFGYITNQIIRQWSYFSITLKNDASSENDEK